MDGSSCSQPNALRTLLGASGWAAYFHQSTLLPGLSLALLYFSVLSLGSLMTSYLAWQGLSEATLSLFRAVGALSGLLATVVFPPLQHCGLGLVGTGALSISWQVGVTEPAFRQTGSVEDRIIRHTWRHACVQTASDAGGCTQGQLGTATQAALADMPSCHAAAACAHLCPAAVLAACRRRPCGVCTRLWSICCASSPVSLC